MGVHRCTTGTAKAALLPSTLRLNTEAIASLFLQIRILKGGPLHLDDDAISGHQTSNMFPAAVTICFCHTLQRDEQLSFCDAAAPSGPASRQDRF